MALPIAPILLANPTSAIQPVSALSNADSGATFQSIFRNAVNKVEDMGDQADRAVQDLLSGANEDVHTPIIATQEASLAFELFMQVRNKLTSAYQSLIGMQL